MLQSLRIQNLALIDDAEIRFGEGLTVFTGESGSGKSTVLDAIALLRGAARPRIQIRKATKSGLAEAEFMLKRDENGRILNRTLGRALDEAGLLSAIDPGEPLVLARRIEPTGRTRSFIQGQTVTRTILAAVASELLDLTGQSEAHRLRTTGAQLLALDQYGGLLAARTEVEDAVQLLRNQESQLEEATRQFGEAQSRRDFLEFQIEELSCCDLDQLDERRARLAQLEEAESTSLAFQEALSDLKFGADSLLGRLEVIARLLPKDTKDSSGAAEVSCDIEAAI
jgi:DNA repair protein RecN (Recombination protein N)